MVRPKQNEKGSDETSKSKISHTISKSFGGVDSSKVVDSTKLIHDSLIKSATLLNSPSDKRLKYESAIKTLTNLGLKENHSIIKLLDANPEHIVRIVSLVKSIKSFNIPITDELCHSIQDNISLVGNLNNLFSLFKEVNLKNMSMSIESLFLAAKFENPFRYGLRKLHDAGFMDKDMFQVMLEYPMHSYTISELIVRLNETGYSMDILIKPFKEVSNDNIGLFSDILNLTLEKNVFSMKVMNAIVSMEAGMEAIYQGAKDLSEDNLLTDSYFIALVSHVKNAVFFAQNIKLLQKLSIIDVNEINDLLPLSQLGSGAYFLMKHLSFNNLLDRENYEIVNKNISLLGNSEVITAFESLPLWQSLQKQDLERILLLMRCEDKSSIHPIDLVEIINPYILPQVFGGLN